MQRITSLSDLSRLYSLTYYDRFKHSANRKQELEALAERGFISDDQYDTIINALPAEASLNARPTPTPAANTSYSESTPSSDRNSPHAPPSYQQAQHHQPPPPPPPASNHREIAHAVALWAYVTPDARDLNLQPGDHISVTEFVNAEWWLGKNIRTGEEGVFPSNYIRRENYPSSIAQAQPQQNAYYGDQKQAQQYHQPGPSDPYSNPVPPVAIAEQQHQTEDKPNKGAEMGKKFGSKLGNAAIFGAGATIGGNIVNSIF